ncbi:hypothetical protein [Glaciimonas sp. PAMC28666]|uniref:hypothetical protein n=1 Tax=Glaciimonas sp. PAMC28666 TaxID=2807626 RepID=UPI001965A309|nr:hypothetical protein [Glaciimonas sp. PAMC28666]QRX85143.1 hypothetical protein JQN73_20470 [Glaciimonas sp. PAMC28666]
MTTSHSITHETTFQPNPAMVGLRIGIGGREISISRDNRKRYYTPNPIIEWRTGLAPGYLELLFLRIWLIRLCAAR